MAQMKKFLLAVIAAVFMLGGCRGSVAVPVSIEPPVIKSFAAEPAIPVVKVFMASPATIVKGFPSKISWDVEGAEYVRISGVGNVRDYGSLLVYPGSTIIYTLYASNRGGSCESTCEVTVEEP